MTSLTMKVTWVEAGDGDSKYSQGLVPSRLQTDE